ncbi:MAG: CdaR family protein [Myxococcales bacterium]|nr:CdaR family protein [Myxococcales bacterium]
MSGRRSLGERLKAAFTQNVGMKLFSILLSVIIFSAVHGAEQAQRSVWVDVVALTPPPGSGKILVSELPERVRLMISGNRSTVNSVLPGTLPPVQIDLREGSLSRYSFFDQEFNLPVGVSITMIDPASFELDWAERVDRRIPIEPILDGEAGLGLVLARPAVVDPGNILVSGPVTEVGPIRTVSTQPVDLSDYGVGRHVVRVGLTRPPPHARYEDEVPVRVTLDIVADVAERRLEGLRIEPVGRGGAVTLRPETVDVLLRGAPARVDLLSPDRLVPFVRIDTLPEAGTFSLRVELRGVPDQVEVLAVDPAEILVTRQPREQL